MRKIANEISNVMFEFIRRTHEGFKKCVELGNGGGELETRLLDILPGLEINSYNITDSEQIAMESKLIFYGGRFRFITSDYRKEKIGHGYDLVLSHCDFIQFSKEEKQRLFNKVHQSLGEKGLFVYCDVVKPPSEKIDAVYRKSGSEEKAQKPFEESSGEEFPEVQYKNQNLLTIDDQMYWMRKAAFKDVDCIWKFFHFAIFVGFK